MTRRLPLKLGRGTPVLVPIVDDDKLNAIREALKQSVNLGWQWTLLVPKSGIYYAYGVAYNEGGVWCEYR